MEAYTQANRHLRIDTPLGEDVLLLERLELWEAISELFEAEVTCLSSEEDIAFDDIVGAEVTLTLEGPSGKRYVHGIVRRFRHEASDGAMFRYSAIVVPRLWLLGRRADCRIFQDMTAPDVIKKVLEGAGVTALEDRLQASYGPRVYCVQYRETDLEFVSRLMEEEGIRYFFLHAEGQHTLVLADDVSGTQPCPNQSSAPFNAQSPGQQDHEVVCAFARQQEVCTNKVTVRDYDFELPYDDLTADSAHDDGDLEHYDYPGEYPDQGEGQRLAQIRLEQSIAEEIAISGTSYCRSFSPGHSFDLEDHPVASQNSSYLLTSIHHHASQEGGFTTGSSPMGLNYQNSFQGVPAEVSYRPTPKTPRPRIAGSQTAVVVGPGGEEIYTDKHGRIKVQFHWDRLGASDENSSLWVRVAQQWAGKNWGTFFLPRIGHEVVVSFLEGDPDQPLVTGRVYNGEHMPPFDLPGGMTKSGLLSRSTKGGSPATANELSFEDKAGAEMVHLHAEKDMSTEVENDQTESVGHDRKRTVGNDESVEVGNNQTIQVGTDKSVTVGSNLTESIGSNEVLSVGADRSRNVGGSETVTVSQNRNHTVAINEAISVGAAQEVTVGALRMLAVGANQETQIGINHNVSVGASQSVDVGSDQSVSVGSKQSISVSKDRSLSVGGSLSETVTKSYSHSAKENITIHADKASTFDAKDQITISCGKASITLKKNGDIILDGKNINLKGSGDIAMKAKKIAAN